MIKYLLLALLTVLSTRVPAQTPAQTYGNSTPKRNQAALGVADAAFLDQLLVAVPGVGTPSRQQLERQNIKSYMMPIRQAPRVDEEWAYALAGVLEFYHNLNNNYKDNLSPDYLILNLAARGQRPTMEDGLRFLAENGTVSAAIVPYGTTSIPPAVYSVPKYRPRNFGYLFRPETRPRNRVFETRKALSRGNPVIVRLATDASFPTLRTGQYGTEQPSGEEHFLTVVGYDATTETFELRGLFGRFWADAGYVRVGYDDFGRLAQMGYVLIPE